METEHPVHGLPDGKAALVPLREDRRWASRSKLSSEDLDALAGGRPSRDAAALALGGNEKTGEARRRSAGRRLATGQMTECGFPRTYEAVRACALPLQLNEDVFAAAAGPGGEGLIVEHILR